MLLLKASWLELRKILGQRIGRERLSRAALFNDAERRGIHKDRIRKGQASRREESPDECGVGRFLDIRQAAMPLL